MNSLRRDALQVFMDVVEDGAYANLRLKDIHRAPSEQAYVSSLVYTALEHVKWADYMLSFYVKPQKKAVRNILRLGVSELFFMDTPDHAAVNGAVELTKECGKGALSGLVNGVLRRMLREKDSLPPLPVDPAARLSIQFGCPEWIVKEWLGRFGEEETVRLLSFEPPAMEIRAQWPFTNEELAAALDVPYARGQVDDHGGAVSLEYRRQCLPVGEIPPNENVPHRGGRGDLFDLPQTPFLQGDFVVRVHIVKADDRTPVQFLQQAHHQIGPDETRRAGHEYRFIIQSHRCFQAASSSL